MSASPLSLCGAGGICYTGFSIEAPQDAPQPCLAQHDHFLFRFLCRYLKLMGTAALIFGLFFVCLFLFFPEWLCREMP